MYHFDWVPFWKYIWPPTAFQDPLIRNGLIVTDRRQRHRPGAGCGARAVRRPGQNVQILAVPLGCRCLYLVFSRHAPAGADGAAVLWAGRNPHL